MLVNLREVSLDDSALIFEWRNSDEIRKWMYADHLIQEEEHQDWINRVLEDQSCKYWIIEFEGKSVGLANIAQIDHLHGRCTWAFYIGEPSTKGSGIGAVTEYLILNFVFEVLELDKLWCEVISENSSVIHLHERFGFRREAYLRSHIKKEGTSRDVVSLGMLKSEWKAVKYFHKESLEEKGFLL